MSRKPAALTGRSEWLRPLGQSRSVQRPALLLCLPQSTCAPTLWALEGPSAWLWLAWRSHTATLEVLPECQGRVFSMAALQPLPLRRAHSKRQALRDAAESEETLAVSKNVTLVAMTEARE